MNFTEAFRSLGYHLENPRTDWSAEKEDGIAITIWQKEMAFDKRAKSLYFDSKLHAKDIAIWRHKPGNTRRIRHLKRALEEFGGFVDVIIVSGTPGQGYGSADPLRLPDPTKRVRVVDFEEGTGHYRVEVVSVGHKQ